MSASQIHDMLQRQIVAEGGCGEGYGLQGGYSDMGEYGGARRRAKKAFPEDAKAGLCAYRLFQAQHKGLTREEMSAKWARHKARTGSGLTAGSMSGGCAMCGGEGGCMCGGAFVREFGSDVDGRCVYRGFRADHKDLNKTALSEGWRGTKDAYFAEMKHEGGFIGQQKVFRDIRAKHKKATRAELSALFEKARQKAHKAMTGKKAPPLPRSRNVGGKTIKELIDKCIAKAREGKVVPEKTITKIVKHPGFTEEQYNILINQVIPALQAKGEKVAAGEVAKVAQACGQELAHEQKAAPIKPKGSGLYGGADPVACERAIEHASEVLMEHPAAQTNPEAAAEVIRAANLSAPIMECGAPGTFAGQACMERNRRLQRLQASEMPLPPAAPMAPSFTEAEWESGAGLMGGRRMTAAQKKAFLRKCMRS